MSSRLRSQAEKEHLRARLQSHDPKILSYQKPKSFSTRDSNHFPTHKSFVNSYPVNQNKILITQKRILLSKHNLQQIYILTSATQRETNPRSNPFLTNVVVSPTPQIPRTWLHTPQLERRLLTTRVSQN